MPNLLDLPGDILSEIVAYCLVPKPSSSGKSIIGRKCHIAQLSPQFYQAVQHHLLRDIRLSLYRDDCYYSAGHQFIHSVKENPAFASRVRSIKLTIYLTLPIRIDKIADDAHKLLERLPNLKKLEIVSHHNKIPFRPGFLGFNRMRALADVSLDDTELRLEDIADYMFLENIKSIRIAHIKEEEVVYLPEKFVGRVSTLESLDLDPVPHLSLQVLEEMLKWPKNLRKLRFMLPFDFREGTTIQNAISAPGIEEALLAVQDSLEGLELVKHGRDFQDYTGLNLNFSRMRVLKKLCCPVECFASRNASSIVMAQMYKLLPESLEILRVRKIMTILHYSTSIFFV